MAELPEIMTLAQQISHELEAKEFESVDVIQEKCLNMEKDIFINSIIGKKSSEHITEENGYSSTFRKMVICC